MKILVFSDVHGNLSALKALLETTECKTADKVIFLGDACIGCSRPNECIELIDKLDCEKIVGNNDLYVCDHVPHVDMLEFTEEKLEMLKYMQDIVTDKNKQIVLSWKKDLTLELAGKTFYFTHYPWEYFDNDANVIDTPAKKNFYTRIKMFAGNKADYIFFGHEHRENHFTDGYKYFYCVGTLGLKSPGYYIVINVDNSLISIDEKCVDFDINYEIDLMDKAGYPYEKSKIKRKI